MDQVDVCGLCYLWKPCWYLRSVLLPWAILMSRVHVANRSHGGCLWFVLLLEAMLMSVACVTTISHDSVCGPAVAEASVDVHGPCCHQRLHGCLWSGLLLEAMWMSVVLAVICAAADYKRPGNVFCSINDYRLTAERDIESFCGNFSS